MLQVTFDIGPPVWRHTHLSYVSYSYPRVSFWCEHSLKYKQLTSLSLPNLLVTRTNGTPDCYYYNVLNLRAGTLLDVVSWWRSIVVRPPVLAGELSPSCARLTAGRVTTLWVKRPLSIRQFVTHHCHSLFFVTASRLICSSNSCGVCDSEWTPDKYSN